MNKHLFLILGLALTLSACDGKDTKKDEAAGGYGAGGPPPSVTIAQPKVQPVNEWREFSGRFEAPETVEIRSRVSGYLNQVLFEDGATVKKGDALFVIDPRPFEATLREKQADLKLAESKTTAADNDYDRAVTLFKSGDISDQLLDQRRSTKDSAHAAVDSAKAAVDSARLDVTYTKITAPITGRISRKLVSEGNLINAGDNILTSIVSMDPIYLYFDVDEKAYVAYTRAGASKDNPGNPGIPVTVALTDETDFTHEGKLDFVDNALDNQTGTMRGRAVLSNPDMLMTPGMFGRVRIRVGGNDKGILIPDAAITVDQTRKLVYVVDDKNTVSSREIETDGMDSGLRIVTKGLEGNEWLVVNGLQRVHDGSTVTPQKEGEKPADATAAPAAKDAAGSAQ